MSLPGIDLDSSGAAQSAVGKAHSISPKRASVIKAARSAKGQRATEHCSIHSPAIVRNHDFERIVAVGALLHCHCDSTRSRLQCVVDEFGDRKCSASVASISSSQQEVDGVDELRTLGGTRRGRPWGHEGSGSLHGSWK